MASLNDILRPHIDLNMALLNMQMSDMMCDVTLIAGDSTRIKAHKLILCATSPFFQKLQLQGNNCSTFLFSNAEADTLSHIVQFIYGNTYAITANNAVKIYPFAIELQLDHAKKVCEYFGASWNERTMGNSKVTPIVNPGPRSRPPLTPGQKFRSAAAIQKAKTPEKYQKPCPASKKRKILEENQNGVDDELKKRRVEDSNGEVSETGSTNGGPQMNGEDDDVISLSPDRDSEHTPADVSLDDSSDLMFECEVCKLMFPSMNTVTKHMKENHPNAAVTSNSSSGTSTPARRGTPVLSGAPGHAGSQFTMATPLRLGGTPAQGNPVVPQALVNGQLNTPPNQGSPSRWKHLSSEQPDPASLWKEFSMPNELDGAEGPKQFKTKRGRPSKTSKAAEGGDVTPKQSKKKSSPNKDKATPVTTASAMHRQEARKTVESRTIKIPDPNLPDGWSKIIVKRFNAEQSKKRYDCYLITPKFSRIKDKKQLAEYIDKNDPSLELAKFSFSVKDALELAGGDPDDQVPDMKAEVKEEGAAPPAAAEPLQATAST